MAGLLKRADALGCDYIATGHYGNIHQHTNGRYYISKGLDELKDQSYVLWESAAGPAEQNTPSLGKYRKTEIRQMALDYGYPELAKKARVMRSVLFPIMITAAS